MKGRRECTEVRLDDGTHARTHARTHVTTTLNVIGLLYCSITNCPITNCPITTWQVN